MKKLLIALLIGVFSTSLVFAQDLHVAKEDVNPPKKEYSPYVEDHYPQNVYFGDEAIVGR